MQFFCYPRDRVGSTPLRASLTEEHWSYMDRFELIARGPTFLDDDTLTGSVHVVELPDVAAARAFVLDEPSYQAGAYRDVLLRRTAWQTLDSSVTASAAAPSSRAPSSDSSGPKPARPVRGTASPSYGAGRSRNPIPRYPPATDASSDCHAVRRSSTSR